MTEDFFFFPKVIWRHYSNEFFLHTKKKSVTGMGISGRSDQKKIRYDERSHDMIRSDRKKIIFVKSLMGTKLDSIFLHTKLIKKLLHIG